MKIVTSTLPAPSAADLGIRLTTIPDIVETAYSVLAVTANGAFIVRSNDQILTVVANNGSQVDYRNSVSNAFESNLYVNESTDRFYFLTKDPGNTAIFLNIVNLATGSLISQNSVTSDQGFASMTVDLFRNELIIYKHDLSEPTLGHSFIYSYDMTADVLSRKHDELGTYSNDTFIHIFLDESNGDYYRAWVQAGAYHLDRMTQTVLDGDFYAASPTAGVTQIKTGAPDGVFYPALVNGRIIAWSEDMSQVNVWDAAALNSQTLVPTTVDSRSGLFHADTKPFYNRWHNDISTSLIHDTRANFSYNYSAHAIDTDRYPVCYQTNTTNAQDPLLSDRQVHRSFSNSKITYIRLKESPGNIVFNLDFGQVCPIDFLVANIHQPIYLDGAKGYGNFEVKDLYAEQEEQGRFTITNDWFKLFEEGDRYVFYDPATNNFELTGSNTQPSVAGWTRANSIVVDRNNGILWTYVGTTLIKIDYVTASLTQITVTTAIQDVVNMFVYADKLYIHHSDGTDAVTTVVDINTSTFTSTVYTGTAIADASEVKVFPNKFTQELWLFDMAASTEIRKLLILPDFNWSDPAVYVPQTILPFAVINSDVGRASTGGFQNFTMDFVDENNILFAREDDFEIINIIFGITGNRSGTLAGLQNGNYTVGSHLQVSGAYLISKNWTNFIFRGAFLDASETFQVYDLTNTTLDAYNTLPEGVWAISSEGYLFYSYVLDDSPDFRDYVAIFDQKTTVDPAFDPLNFNLGSVVLTKLDELEVQQYQLELLDCDIQEYGRENPLEQAVTVFNDTYGLDTHNYPLAPHQWKIKVFVNQLKLVQLVNIFELQWQESVSKRSWLLFLDDYVTESVDDHRRHKLRAGLNGEFHYRYSVAITSLEWDWVFKDKYSVDLVISEYFQESAFYGVDPYTVQP